MNGITSTDPALPTPAPLFHPTNIIQRPGGTAAGVAIISQLAAQGTPSTTYGWVMFAFQALGGVAAMLGK